MSTKSAIVILVVTFLVLSPLAAQAHLEAPIVPIVFPATGDYQVTDTFGDPRSGGRTHKGADIFAAKGTALRAATTGTIYSMKESGLGGYSLIIEGDDGNFFYYAHLNNDSPGTDDGLGGPEAAYASDLYEGKAVLAGDIVAYVGDSGNAEGTASHVHFEIWPNGGAAICPKPSLDNALFPDDPLSIMAYAGFESVWATPTPFSPNFDGVDDTSSFGYTIGRAAHITIKIYNYLGEVRTVIDSQSRAAGRHYEGWTGTNNNGNILQPGNYRYIITAKDAESGLISSTTGVVSVAP